MIISKQNSLIKEIRSLLNKKYRDSLGRYVVEGVKMVNEAFALGQKVLTVVCTEKCLNLLAVTGVEVTLVSDDVYNSISDEKSPQGALAVIEKPSFQTPNEKSCVMLDGVSDPGNMGTIIRTMACAGYRDLYISDDCADPFSPKAVRSSMSGIYHVNVIRKSRQELVNDIKFPLIVADMHGENVFDRKIDGEFCLVIGNEARGISDFIREKASLTVKIPMQEGMESLNAGVSAGILMYALKNSR